MKKNLFLRLCLILGLLSLNSCRQDLLPEHETYNNSSAFQLTSKRISLNESKHKAKLLPELEKAEVGIEAFLRKNLHGKTVNYANGISINTDDVIYIENGSNYYTYTFRINRENPAANAPVENLVLSPLSDGTYRELLVSYNLTDQEKQTIINGGFVDLQGKMQTTEVATGTYSGQIFSKTTSTQCHWETYTYTTPCACHPGHYDATECNCAKGKPKQYVLTWNVCEEVEDTAPSAGPSSPGGSSAGGGSTNPGGSNGANNPNQPCDGNGIPSQPQNPDSTLGNQPCNNGTPTLPNLSLSNPEDVIPCNKLKNLLDPTKANLKPLITGGMYDYINASSGGETGIYIRKDTKGKVTTEVAPFTGTNSLPSKWGTSYYSEVHTHPKNVYPMFSYSDMMVLYNLEYQSYSYNQGHSSMLLVCEDDNGIKQTYAVVFENIGAPIENTLNNPNLIGKTQKEKLKALDGILNKMYDKELSKKTLDPSYKPNYERVFLQFCFGTNIGLYKADSNLINWSKLTISNNSDTATVTPTNCN